MALKLATNNPYDGVAEDAYWKIVEVNINFLEQSSHVTMNCWLDAECRSELRRPIDSRSYDWSGEDFPFTFDVLNAPNSNTVKIAYEKIKSLTTLDSDGNEVAGEFSEAENI